MDALRTLFCRGFFTPSCRRCHTLPVQREGKGRMKQPKDGKHDITMYAYDLWVQGRDWYSHAHMVPSRLVHEVPKMEMVIDLGCASMRR